jgi:hypothetical protein
MVSRQVVATTTAANGIHMAMTGNVRGRAMTAEWTMVVGGVAAQVVMMVRVSPVK